MPQIPQVFFAPQNAPATQGVRVNPHMFDGEFQTTQNLANAAGKTVQTAAEIYDKIDNEYDSARVSELKVKRKEFEVTQAAALKDLDGDKLKEAMEDYNRASADFWKDNTPKNLSPQWQMAFNDYKRSAEFDGFQRHNDVVRTKKIQYARNVGMANVEADIEQGYVTSALAGATKLADGGIIPRAEYEKMKIEIPKRAMFNAGVAMSREDPFKLEEDIKGGKYEVLTPIQKDQLLNRAKYRQNEVRSEVISGFQARIIASENRKDVKVDYPSDEEIDEAAKKYKIPEHIAANLKYKNRKNPESQIDTANKIDLILDGTARFDANANIVIINPKAKPQVPGIGILKPELYDSEVEAANAVAARYEVGLVTRQHFTNKEWNMLLNLVGTLPAGPLEKDKNQRIERVKKNSNLLENAKRNYHAAFLIDEAIKKHHSGTYVQFKNRPLFKFENGNPIQATNRAGEKKWEDAGKTIPRYETLKNSLGDDIYGNDKELYEKSQKYTSEYIQELVNFMSTFPDANLVKSEVIDAHMKIFESKNYSKTSAKGLAGAK